MPIGQSTTGQNYLPGKICFEVWVEMRTLGLARQVMTNAGYINPIRSTPPTRPGIETAAKKWMIEHPQEAREILLAARAKAKEEGSGDLYAFADDDEAYAKTLVRYAHSVLTKNKYAQYLQRYAPEGI